MNEILSLIDWAVNTIRDRELFGRDELGAALARERRAKSVLLDCKEEIEKLHKENLRLREIIRESKEYINIADFKDLPEYIKAMEFRDWQTCDFISDGYEKLKEDIKDI